MNDQNLNKNSLFPQKNSLQTIAVEKYIEYKKQQYACSDRNEVHCVLKATICLS